MCKLEGGCETDLRMTDGDMNALVPTSSREISVKKEEKTLASMAQSQGSEMRRKIR